MSNLACDVPMPNWHCQWGLEMDIYIGSCVRARKNPSTDLTQLKFPNET